MAENHSTNADTKPDTRSRDYLVTVFKRFKSGDLYVLDLRVSVSQSIDWVRNHVVELVAIGMQQDKVERLPHLPIVALNVAYLN